MEDRLFKRENREGFNFLVFEPWQAAGFVHGFIGAGADFSDRTLQSAAKGFCRVFGAARLYVLDQVHSASYHIFNHARDHDEVDTVFRPGSALHLARADAFIVRAQNAGHNFAATVAFGIRTADCLPIIVKSKTLSAIIHAGWRGLSGGILENVLEFFKHEGHSEVQAVIGPAAGQECYAVGPEVLDSFKGRASFREAHGRSWLSLSDTALSIINGAGFRRAEVFDCRYCTICSSDFHSYRRTGKTLSNLTFMLHGGKRSCGV